MPDFEKIQFYYSSKITPGDKYPCDNDKALETIEQLKAKGLNAEAIDVETAGDLFRIYNFATTGPEFNKRAAFGGDRGANYEEFFGKTIPALLCWEDAGSRAPSDVWPRMDNELNRLVGVNEALESQL